MLIVYIIINSYEYLYLGIENSKVNNVNCLYDYKFLWVPLGIEKYNKLRCSSKKLIVVLNVVQILLLLIMLMK